MKKIAYTKPSISDLEVEYATDAARNGWGSHCYDYIDQFEEKLCSHLGVKHAIATSSCTGALHMGLSALGVGYGDEVIVADINWIASVAPITYLGAKPVLVDIERDTWCIDADLIEKKITKKTKAIIAVHLYGNLCDLDKIMAIGKRYSIPIIEDSAEAIGSEYYGRKAGTIGDFGVFSFHGTKTITTGEGGAFVTNNTDLYSKVLTLSNHGRSVDQKKQFWPDRIGFKYKMSNIQAAIGCAQLERIEELIENKRSLFFRYYDAFSEYDQLSMNPIPSENIKYGYWMPTIVIDSSVNKTRDDLLCKMNDANIDGRVFFYPLSMLNLFDCVKSNNPVSYDVYYRAINLPSYYEIDDNDFIRIINIIKDFL